jgi:transcription-repair coupling factor (superfamily II helicase)
MDIKAHLERLVPNAKICVGHGKLSKDKLEDVISSFINKEYDVLLCTTIIESGIDMPDTNTLIVHDADRLGLSQMYQIRGRVGRSNRIAYCYLMYDENKILTEEARKRLDTIKEFNELGSGFKIAMRDLSIRGSGDILGSEQSGFIETVCLDMYKKILDEEIQKKNNPVEEETKEEIKEEEIVDISLRAPMVSETVSDNYIDNDYERILIHKRIDSLKSLNELKELEEELIDRFGPISDELYAFMYEKL